MQYKVVAENCGFWPVILGPLAFLPSFCRVWWETTPLCDELSEPQNFRYEEVFSSDTTFGAFHLIEDG